MAVEVVRYSKRDGLKTKERTAARRPSRVAVDAKLVGLEHALGPVWDEIKRARLSEESLRTELETATTLLCVAFCADLKGKHTADCERRRTVVKAATEVE